MTDQTPSTEVRLAALETMFTALYRTVQKHIGFTNEEAQTFDKALLGGIAGTSEDLHNACERLIRVAQNLK